MTRAKAHREETDEAPAAVGPAPDPMEIPPPRGGAVDVEPPPWGWRGDVKKLTAGEAGVIRKLLGGSLDENPLGWAMYAAVAFARRLDPEKYPWEIAERLELGDVVARETAAEDADPT